jgi:hypothetical protein
LKFEGKTFLLKLLSPLQHNRPGNLRIGQQADEARRSPA